MDTEINTCSNNAAFVITLATEMFIQYLAQEGQNMAKLERKPRRNVQYKDLANAVLHHDNLEFLEDTIPKTTPYNKVREQAAATRAKLQGKKAEMASEKGGDDGGKEGEPSGKKVKVNGKVNGKKAKVDDDPSAQLEMEMRERGRDEDVEMEG